MKTITINCARCSSQADIICDKNTPIEHLVRQTGFVQTLDSRYMCVKCENVLKRKAETVGLTPACKAV